LLHPWLALAAAVAITVALASAVAWLWRRLLRSRLFRGARGDDGQDGATRPR
jgi:cobalamin synthase